jgi:aspartate/methionine/tyrosine aminotransferase
MPSDPSAFVPPPYPHDRLGPVRTTAAAVPGGMLDASVGTPVDPMPAVVLDALAAAAPGATGYPATIGSPAFRDAAVGWVERRFGCPLTTDDVIACIGTKEVVASLPRMLSLRDPSRDTVLYPAVAYPTYELGALLAGLRAVPVPVDDDWHLDLGRVDPADADRALLLWLNDPSNPTGAVASPQGMVDAVEWARARGVVVASDECYAEFTYDAAGARTAPAARGRARHHPARPRRRPGSVPASSTRRACASRRGSRPTTGRRRRTRPAARPCSIASTASGRRGPRRLPRSGR